MSATLLDVETERGARTDLERLQGAWVTVAGRRPALLLIAGHAFAIHFRGGDIYGGGRAAGPEERPGLMHTRTGGGPPRHRGEIAPCIYEGEGDELRWCGAEPGSEVRLTAFPPVEDRRYLCMVFRREK